MSKFVIGQKETKEPVCFLNGKKISYGNIDFDNENMRVVYGFNGDLDNMYFFDNDDLFVGWVKKQKNSADFLKQIENMKHLSAYAEKTGEFEFFEKNGRPSNRFLAYQEKYLAKAQPPVKQPKSVIPGLGAPTLGWYYGSENIGDTGEGFRLATRFNPFLLTFNNRISSVEIIGLIPRAFCTRIYYTGQWFWVWPPAQVWAMSFAGIWINNDTTSVF